MFFQTPELLPMADCERAGDLSQVIELQPVNDVVRDQCDCMVDNQSNGNVTKEQVNANDNAEVTSESKSASRWSFWVEHGKHWHQRH